jgi:hypothetical protein
MPLQVNVDTGTRPSPQIVAANIVVQHARSVGNPNASQALAVTVPICRVDQSGLQSNGNAQGRLSFDFKPGFSN